MGAQPLSVEDGLGNVTNFLPVGEGQYHWVEKPEGDKVSYSFDDRRNITQTVRSAKPGSGLASITTSAVFPTACTNPLTCNKPTSTTDAKGNVTDYTYDPVHGGVLTVTAPAAAGGVRPQTRYSYTALHAWYKNGAGVLVQAPTPIYRLTGISRCQTLANCTGTADEVKTTIAYGTSGIANNLLPTSVTTSAGDGSLSATTSFTYDEVGNLLTVDGPLSGTADTVRTRYDAGRQIVGIIGPDPDGPGGRKHRAQRLTYNADGQVTIAEHGTVDGQSDADWGSFAAAEAVTSTYDAKGRKIGDVLSAGGVSHGVSQYSYDALDRLECTALRMNSALWNSLPSSACTVQAAGAAGPDRITKNIYDVASRLIEVQTAYGTADQANEAVTYTNNGQVATVADGKGNRTTYEYDGHDRLKKTRYPDPALAGVSSTADYEELGYDPNGNVTSRRLRDGQVHNFTYDNLNRVTLKDVPGSEPDVSYAYDLLGRLTGASQSGNALTFGFDALGRNLTQSGALGTASYQYDLAGQRTRVTHPGGFFVDYDYDLTGNVIAIRENGASSGAGVLAVFGYDDLGRRTSVTRGNGAVTSYGYDGVSRLASLTHDLAGTSADVTKTFGYNPASQIASTTRSNDAYAFTGFANINRTDAINGLNQVTATGGTGVSHDVRGNISAIGASGYGYSSENLLTSGPGVSLSHDPLLRLHETAGTRFLYDRGDLIGEVNGSGTLVKRYVHGPGMDEPLVEYDAAGNRRWLHADERGSIVAVSDGAGNAIAINSYDEYGIPAAGNVGRFQYTGQAWLPELGMYYYKARIYSPTLGRFMQADPIGYGDGLNLYAYVKGDPVNFTDPSGTQQADATIIGQAWHSSGGGSGSATGYVSTYPDDPDTVDIVRFKMRTRYAAASGSGLVAPQSLQRNGQKPPSHDDGDPDYNRDLNKCRSLSDSGNKAAASRCYASAGVRKGLRDGGTPESKLPPLITWRNPVSSAVIQAAIIYSVVSGQFLYRCGCRARP